GAKAASKRDRKGQDTKVAKSQINEQAIQCITCKSTFLKTTRAPALPNMLQTSTARLFRLLPNFRRTCEINAAHGFKLMSGFL
ncbi:hypothetical protein LOCC1_G008904, partial [Lachnellula occidentalis]